MLDQLTGGRLDFGVGRGVAPIEHFWFGSTWAESKERFEDTLGIICDAFATGEISSANSKYHDFPTMPMSTKAVPGVDPVLVSGQSGHGRPPRHEPDVRRPVPQSTYDVYVETWHKHKGDTMRVDGPDARPRVGCTMLVAIAPTENEALEIARRGMDGLIAARAQRAPVRPPRHDPGGVRRGDRSAALRSCRTTRTRSAPAPARPTRSPSGSRRSSSPG